MESAKLELFPGLGKVDPQFLTVERIGVEQAKGFISLGLGAHGNESKAPGYAIPAVFDQIDCSDGSGFLNSSFNSSAVVDLERFRT